MRLRFLGTTSRKNNPAKDSITIGIADMRLPSSFDFKNLIQSSMLPNFSDNHHPNLIQIQSTSHFIDIPLNHLNQLAPGSIEKSLSEIINKLNLTGANFILVPDVGLQRYMVDIRKKFPTTTIISAADAVVKECMQKRYDKVGILGDSDNEFHALLQNNGIDAEAPSDSSQEMIDDTLVLLKNRHSETIRQYAFSEFMSAAAELKRRGCNAIIVTNPVIAMFLKNTHLLPIVNTTSVLAEVATRKTQFLQQEKQFSNQLNNPAKSRL